MKLVCSKQMGFEHLLMVTVFLFEQGTKCLRTANNFDRRSLINSSTVALFIPYTDLGLISLPTHLNQCINRVLNNVFTISNTA